MPSEQRAELQVAVQHCAGAIALDVSFRARAPWTVLFGPSGSGKTTVLRAIAGFLRPHAGRIVSNSAGTNTQVLFDGRQGIAIPPHRRPVRTSGQRAQMFARRTVRENVGFGAEGRIEIVESALKHLRLQEIAGKPVERLSGGEQQRVAVARAVAATQAAGPGTWLLLDEPFTGLDLDLRSELTRSLPSWLKEQGHPVLSVTHDVAEVFALNAEVVRLAEGRVVEMGSFAKVLAQHRTRLLSDLHA